MKKRTIGVICLLIFLCIQLSAEGRQEEPREGDVLTDTGVFSPRTVIDAMGREVTINRPIEKISFSHSYPAEILKILDCWDLVAGKGGSITGDEGFFYPGHEELPVICSPQTIYDVNYEKILELNTDLFITVKSPYPGFDEMTKSLEPDVPVFVSGEGDEASLRSLARLLGKENEAEEYLSWKKQIQDSIMEKTKDLPDEKKPLIFLKTGMDINSFMTPTNESEMAVNQIKAAGVINAAGELPAMGGWVMNTDREWLVTVDPEIVISFFPAFGAIGYGVDDTGPAARLAGDTASLDVFSGGRAAANGRIYMILYTLFTTPRSPVFTAYLAKWCHPELFADLDPEAIHQEYLTRFMRIDYDLGRHGVIAYPPVN